MMGFKQRRSVFALVAASAVAVLFVTLIFPTTAIASQSKPVAVQGHEPSRFMEEDTSLEIGDKMHQMQQADAKLHSKVAQATAFYSKKLSALKRIINKATAAQKKHKPRRMSALDKIMSAVKVARERREEKRRVRRLKKEARSMHLNLGYLKQYLADHSRREAIVEAQGEVAGVRSDINELQNAQSTRLGKAVQQSEKAVDNIRKKENKQLIRLKNMLAVQSNSIDALDKRVRIKRDGERLASKAHLKELASRHNMAKARIHQHIRNLRRAYRRLKRRELAFHRRTERSARRLEHERRRTLREHEHKRAARRRYHRQMLAQARRQHRKLKRQAKRKFQRMKREAVSEQRYKHSVRSQENRVKANRQHFYAISELKRRENALEVHKLELQSLTDEQVKKFDAETKKKMDDFTDTLKQKLDLVVAKTNQAKAKAVKAEKSATRAANKAVGNANQSRKHFLAQTKHNKRMQQLITTKAKAIADRHMSASQRRQAAAMKEMQATHNRARERSLAEHEKNSARRARHVRSRLRAHRRHMSRTARAKIRQTDRMHRRMRRSAKAHRRKMRSSVEDYEDRAN
jgi:hypothetical protein